MRFTRCSRCTQQVPRDIVCKHSKIFYCPSCYKEMMQSPVNLVTGHKIIKILANVKKKR